MCICTWKWTPPHCTGSQIRSTPASSEHGYGRSEQSQIKVLQNPAEPSDLHTGWNSEPAGLKNNWTFSLCCYMVVQRFGPCLLSSLKVIWLNLVQTALMKAAQHPCNRVLLIPNGSPCGIGLYTYNPEIKLQANPDKSHPLHGSRTCNPILDHKSAHYIAKDSYNDSV